METMEPAPTRVAVVEGQYLLREALTTLLEGAGFQVVGHYAEPDVFMSHIPEDRPAVALLGLTLGAQPEPLRPDGLSVVRELHRRHPDVGLVLLSDASRADSVERCYQEGAAGYLDRHSAQRDSVVNAVSAVARGERVFPVGMLGVALTPSPAQPEPAVLQSISPREREVLSYIAAGADNLKIATMLRISERTVKAHVTSLYRKLGSENRIQLALEARQLGVRPSSLA